MVITMIRVEKRQISNTQKNNRTNVVECETSIKLLLKYQSPGGLNRYFGLGSLASQYF